MMILFLFEFQGHSTYFIRSGGQNSIHNNGTEKRNIRCSLASGGLVGFRLWIHSKKHWRGFPLQSLLLQVSVLGTFDEMFIPLLKKIAWFHCEQHALITWTSPFCFASGVFGSGLCILSKYPIISALFHSWAVNGYAHRIQHGDWFGGKGVGLCRLLVQNRPVNLYIAHVSFRVVAEQFFEFLWIFW